MPDDHRLTQKVFAFMMSALVLLLNEHWWTRTGSCFKNSRAIPSSEVCRYSFPHEPVLTTAFNAKGVQLYLKPAHEYINGFNPVMMAAFKSNHDIQILLGGKNVVNLIYYYCKYVTKTQHQVDSVAAVGLAAFQR
ncbi:hypothetical protein L916_15473 [Phytophthora nicotianae]|uniref:Uncharacterized protein n=1 Tax=Phytophthora nicotianae TaxID=4792 RepID=W2IC98_PHYNI|nr:hypothetical protein L916_15473 [Phytophthora nicotianae]